MDRLPQFLPDVSFYAPRVCGSELTVHAWQGTWKRNRWGILEPEGEPEIDPSVLDTVVLPGLAFDRLGHRLGYGGGFYDRWLATNGLHMLKIGLTHFDLWVDALPFEVHDQNVDALVTDRGWFDLRIRPKNI